MKTSLCESETTSSWQEEPLPNLKRSLIVSARPQPVPKPWRAAVGAELHHRVLRDLFPRLVTGSQDERECWWQLLRWRRESRKEQWDSKSQWLPSGRHWRVINSAEKEHRFFVSFLLGGRQHWKGAMCYLLMLRYIAALVRHWVHYLRDILSLYLWNPDVDPKSSQKQEYPATTNTFSDDRSPKWRVALSKKRTFPLCSTIYFVQ